MEVLAMVGRNTPSGRTFDGMVHRAAGGNARDVEDHRQLRHGRGPLEGFVIGQYIQSPPFFFTRDGHHAPLCDMYRGAAAFLIAGGPSFGKLDNTRLAQPGILTMGLNNSVKTFRPRMWCCVDDPSHYIRSIWLDPTLMKFVPFCHAEKPIFDSSAWKFMDKNVGDCPNVWYYRRNEHFVADQYLFEDTINWGNHTDLGGGRSVMLAAMRILFLLGIRRIFLLGVDFKMSADSRYHFEQNRSRSSIKGNNTTYRFLEQRFRLLRPIFERHGLQVFNCNCESGLKAFDYLPFEEACRVARESLPENLAEEPTEGLYEREANERRRLKNIPTGVPSGAVNESQPISKVRPADIGLIERSVRAARDALRNAKIAEEELLGCNHDDPRRHDATGFQAKMSLLHQQVVDRRREFRTLVRKREFLRTTFANQNP
jgi:hypothetical protein